MTRYSERRFATGGASVRASSRFAALTLRSTRLHEPLCEYSNVSRQMAFPGWSCEPLSALSARRSLASDLAAEHPSGCLRSLAEENARAIEQRSVAIRSVVLQSIRLASRQQPSESSWLVTQTSLMQCALARLSQATRAT